MTQPSLTISSLDLDRLEDLLEQVDPREFPAARQLETAADPAGPGSHAVFFGGSG